MKPVIEQIGKRYVFRLGEHTVGISFEEACELRRLFSSFLTGGRYGNKPAEDKNSKVPLNVKVVEKENYDLQVTIGRSSWTLGKLEAKEWLEAVEEALA